MGVWKAACGLWFVAGDPWKRRNTSLRALLTWLTQLPHPTSHLLTSNPPPAAPPPPPPVGEAKRSPWPVARGLWFEGCKYAPSHRRGVQLDVPSQYVVHRVREGAVRGRWYVVWGFHRPRITGHMPLFRVIPAKRAFGSREPVQTGVLSVARGCRKKRW